MNKGNMKPPFSYYGGKQRMAHNIIPLIPKHTVYVEPFCGSATIMFKKPWPEVTNSHNYREVINDTERELVNFFEQLQKRGAELCQILSFQLYSHSDFKKAKSRTGDNEMSRAVDFYINIMMCFGGVLHGGWGVSAKGGNNPYAFLNSVNRLPEYVQRMRGTAIECIDALDLIKKWDSEQTFFYIDPPYVNTYCGDYAKYTLSDLQNLVDTLKAIKGQFLLSGYDNHDIEIPFDKISFDAVNTSKKSTEGIARGKRVETVWYKYTKTEDMPEWLQKLYNSGKYDCFTGGDSDRQTSIF